MWQYKIGTGSSVYCNIATGGMGTWGAQCTCTVLKSWTFSVVNHWVLHGQCDRLRNFMTLFGINRGKFWNF